jgi:hypothetical protein
LVCWDGSDGHEEECEGDDGEAHFGVWFVVMGLRWVEVFEAKGWMGVWIVDGWRRGLGKLFGGVICRGYHNIGSRRGGDTSTYTSSHHSQRLIPLALM